MSVSQAFMAPQPGDLSGQFNTQLSPEDEARFQQWLKQSGRTRDLYDYDLRGAWKSDAKAAANGHLPDTWKKPNHPTFSQESIYSNASSPGGQWRDAGNGKWVYWASDANLQYRNAPTLANYFARVEPDSSVILPSTYRMGQGGK